MTREHYDIILIGGGSAGLTGASFAAKIGARVALIEKQRIGGDCTWTGCVPSKALIKVASIVHKTRLAPSYGIEVAAPRVEMSRVRAHVNDIVHRVYSEESPERLLEKGIHVVMGAATFTDERTIHVGEQDLTAAYFVIATGASPALPNVPGLTEVPFVTYETLFDNERLPSHLLVLGAGPIGMEMAQAYRRLGAEVTLIGEKLLPREEPEVRALVAQVFAAEGIRCIAEKALRAHREGDQIVLATASGELRGDMLLVATGRRPQVEGLGLELAGVAYDAKGIKVNDSLRTSTKHIYAAGDVTGGQQFTHFAGWQCFQAVRNALLVGSARGFSDVVPAVTFMDPEVAHVGLLEAEARTKLGDDVQIHQWDMSHADRAVCDDENVGLIKLVARKDGTLIGASIVASRAGEMIAELALAVQRKLTVTDLAGIIHAYPTWSTAVQQLASEAAISQFVDGRAGKVALGLSRWLR